MKFKLKIKPPKMKGKKSDYLSFFCRISNAMRNDISFCGSCYNEDFDSSEDKKRENWVNGYFFSGSLLFYASTFQHNIRFANAISMIIVIFFTQYVCAFFFGTTSNTDITSQRA